MKITEFFAGIGAFRQAAINQNIDHEVKGISEYDQYAIKSYMAMYGETENYGDITKIRTIPKSDMWTYGFPCQDISVAGNQEGIKEGTRSGLLLEFEKILESSVIFNEQPNILLMENVKNLVGKKHKAAFERWISKLEELGYNSYWQVLNTKNHGLPQNRERVFCLSVKKELDKGFEFPEKQELKLRLKDMLEDEVDEKYYLSDNAVKRLHNNGKGYHSKINSEIGAYLFAGMYKISRGMDMIAEPVIAASRGRNPENPSDRTTGSATEQRLEVNKQGLSNTITTVQKDNYVVEPKINQIGMLDIKGNEQVRRVYGSDGISPTLNTMQGGNRQPKVIIDDTQGFEKEPRIYKNYSPSLRATRSGLKTVDNFRIRKLLPIEVWRLQGFSDEQFKKAEAVCSSAQLYKQAGNSISVPVLEAIYNQMIKFGYMEVAE